MKKIDYIVLSLVEPTDKNTIWAYPVGNGLVSLRVFNNGEWASTDQTIDLTPYLKKADAQNLYLSKTDAQDTYATKSSLSSHTSDDSNPHKVTKDQIGLGNVDNTSDVDKPVSTAVQGALDLKQNKTDDTLDTENKTVVGAINEVKGIADSKQVAGDYATNAALTEGLATKQDTITAGTGLEFEGTTLNVTLDITVFKVVSALPDSPAQGDENKIHLVPAVSTGANNAYTEYVWVNSAWEILGEYTSEVDLTPYLKTADAADTYLSKTDAASTYLSKTDASSTYLSKTDAASTYLIKTAAVGKIDPTSDGTGEIFNCYEGDEANIASGNYSHAEGYGNEVSGVAAHAEGRNNIASNNYTHAEGHTTTASGIYSHSEGQITTASGQASHAEGFNVKASGSYSHAEGSYTQALGASEHAEGKYNKSYDSTSASVRVIHSVGIGSSESDRKNAHEIKINGDHYVYGVGGFDGTNSDTAQTLQTVLANLAPKITEVPELTADYNIPANATMVENIYMITIGATVYDVTGAADIKWAGGVTPTVSANSILVVSVLNNLATWQTFI